MRSRRPVPVSIDAATFQLPLIATPRATGFSQPTADYEEVGIDVRHEVASQEWLNLKSTQASVQGLFSPLHSTPVMELDEARGKAQGASEPSGQPRREKEWTDERK